MKTLREIYNPPAATAAEIYRWSETLKFGQWSALDCSTGKIMWARETPGMISASSGPSGLMARIRLKRPGATVGWAGSPPPAVVPCEPVVEGAETNVQSEQMEILLQYIRGEVRQWVFAGEWEAIVKNRKAVKAEVKGLRRKAKVLAGGNGDPGKAFRDRAKALARFVQVKEVLGLRVCYWPERVCWCVAEFHTGKGIGAPSVKSAEGRKRHVIEELMQGVRERVQTVGLAGMIEALDQFPVVNYPGELPAGAKEMGLVS
jgi:hypothetical protein